MSTTAVYDEDEDDNNQFNQPYDDEMSLSDDDDEHDEDVFNTMQENEIR